MSINLVISNNTSKLVNIYNDETIDSVDKQFS